MTNGERRTIARMLAADMTSAAIADATGYSAPRIRQLARAWGMHRRPGRPPSINQRLVNLARLMYDRGDSLGAIALRVGRTTPTICYWRDRFGWPLRGDERVQESKETDLPLVWRCPCDPRQLHKAGECCKRCGCVPPWAEAS